jgi:hypothetical protein
MLKTLGKATKCLPQKDQNRQEYLFDLVNAATELPDDEWYKLPEEAQDWVNKAVDDVQNGADITDPEPIEEKPARRRPEQRAAKKPAEAEPVDEEPEEAAEDETVPVHRPPAKKAGRKGPSSADVFRRAYIKALCSGETPNPTEVAESLGLELSKDYVASMAWEIRKTCTMIREEGFLKK